MVLDVGVVEVDVAIGGMEVEVEVDDVGAAAVVDGGVEGADNTALFGVGAVELVIATLDEVCCVGAMLGSSPIVDKTIGRITPAARAMPIALIPKGVRHHRCGCGALSDTVHLARKGSRSLRFRPGGFRRRRS